MELTLLAYDKSVWLLHSKDAFYFTAGMSTRAIINEICREWGFAVSYEWEYEITHGEKTFFGTKSIGHAIFSLLDEVREKTGHRYVLHYRDGSIKIEGYGTNEPVYLLDRTGTVSTYNKVNINNLVTRVKVYGRADNIGHTPVEAVLDGDTRFGVMQEIVFNDRNKTLDEAMSEAQVILADRGKPEELIKWNGPDLPFLRKGDKVEIIAGNLRGYFYVEGVCHCGDSRGMGLTLRKVRGVVGGGEIWVMMERVRIRVKGMCGLCLMVVGLLVMCLGLLP